jgi:hypothetical protein
VAAQVTVDEEALNAAINQECRIISPEVERSAVDAGYSSSRMCAAGLSPLWRGLRYQLSGLPDVFPVTRFTFSDRHGLFWRSVEVTELPNGTGMMEIVGGGFTERSIGREWQDMSPTERPLSHRQMDRINGLIAASGTFDHAIATWDMNDEGVAIFLDCQLLEMEQLAIRGYRFSSVNIGCHRPRRLMPLVDAVVELANIGMVRSGWAGR